VRKGARGHWAGDRKQTTVWAIPHRRNETGHGTQKPVECMRRPIENNSSPGQAVYEPFCGSGTTIIAAEMTGRACHAIELDPAYVDVAIARWQDFTGQAAVLDGSCLTHLQVKAERLGEER
jgi:DNA modification methylase